MTSARFLIAASGTGGHLFPARHIARALMSAAPDAKIEFVGSGRPLEKEVIDAAGFTRHEVPLVGLKHRGLKGLLQFVLMLPPAFAQVWSLLSDFKPDVVIGVGGYVTFLPITLARLRGIPTWIHEAELIPGMANAVLGRYATKVSIAFEQAKMPRRDNIVFTGHPLRPELVRLAGERPSLDGVVRRLMITGGSQGAIAIDEAMIALAPLLKERGIEIWHQCRKDAVQITRTGYQAAGVTARVEPFINDVAEAFHWADAIVSRSGAGAVMELGVVNKPCILVPYPFAQANHQRANAHVLVDAGKALLCEQGAGFNQRLGEALQQILTPAFYQEMQKRPFVGRRLDAAERIANGCLALVSR